MKIIKLIDETRMCHMLSVRRPDNTSVHTGFSSLIRLTRSYNYIECNKKLVHPILIEMLKMGTDFHY